jgi:UDP-glucuronate 4-epimerase
MATFFVTGGAGFIGSSVSHALLARGDDVIGIDNLNGYYDVTLKEARLARLTSQPGFTFRKLDVSDRDGVMKLAEDFPVIDGIVHLAAQAGVRYSLIDPYAYVTSNVMGQVVMLELARKLKALKHFVYASSSSVYGGNTELPFSVDDAVEKPNSLYAATKRADELFSQTYAHLYKIPLTGLRFFTVYGPWGRPDMAPLLFSRAILAGRPIEVFNRGRMRRDFTYIDDIVDGVIASLDHPPADDGAAKPGGSKAPHAIYNLGNSRPEPLLKVISIIEEACGRRAVLDMQPMQPGDVPRTFADISETERDLGWQPTTPVEIGFPQFVSWFKDYHGLG